MLSFCERESSAVLAVSPCGWPDTRCAAQVVKRMMGAFEKRCEHMYGSSAFSKRQAAQKQKLQSACSMMNCSHIWRSSGRVEICQWGVPELYIAGQKA